MLLIIVNQERSLLNKHDTVFILFIINDATRSSVQVLNTMTYETLFALV